MSVNHRKAAAPRCAALKAGERFGKGAARARQPVSAISSARRGETVTALPPSASTIGATTGAESGAMPRFAAIAIGASI